MVNYIDLIALLGKVNRVSNATVYGIVRKEVERPSNLGENIIYDEKEGCFCEVELFGVNLESVAKYLDTCGYGSNTYNYMVNGSIVSFIKKSDCQKDRWVKFSGTLTSSKSIRNFLSMFGWSKLSGEWALKTPEVEDLNASIFLPDDTLFQHASKSIEFGVIVQPDKVSMLPQFYAYDVRSNVKVNPSKSGNVYTSTEKDNVRENTGDENDEGFKMESRNTIKPFASSWGMLSEKYDLSRKKRDEFVNKEILKYKKGDTISPYISFMISGIGRFYTRKLSTSGSTGKTLVRKYLGYFGKDMESEYMGTSVKNFLLNDFEEIGGFMEHGDIVNCTKKAWDCCKAAFGDPERFYIGIVSQIVGVSYESLCKVLEFCNELDISISRILNENPYLLQLLSTLSYQSIEHIALCFGKSGDRELDRYRNIAVINSYIMDGSNGSTVFLRSDMEKKGIGTSLTKAKYEKNRDKGTYLSEGTVINLKAFVRDRGDFGYVSSGWRLHGGKAFRPLSKEEFVTAISDYVESGLGIPIGSYITSDILLKKELYVYEKMYAISSRKFEYMEDEVNQYIAEYEDMVGFKFEKEQRDAVMLCMNSGGIISGSAGSGKTTVSNCLVYVLGRLESGNIEFKFAAPTGKAAKRMQEVVKRPVRTMNSLFRIFSGESVTMNNKEEEEEEESGGNTCYFFDEGAMVSLDLMYSVLKKIPEEARVYIFGDSNQLSPIGKGLPFKNLLRFMPCVFLTVSKRATEGSSITNNSNIINNMSQMSNWKGLESGGDFYTCPCGEDMTVPTVISLCKHYMNKNTVEEDDMLKARLGVSELPVIEGLTKDDIQVVTPLAKATYTWGSIRLNSMLQPIFNPIRGYSNTIIHRYGEDSYSKFMIGDRVIHTDKNMYSMQWYESYQNKKFVKTYGFGVCNGDVGKIVAYYKASECEFMSEVSEKPDGFEYPKAMRDDSMFCAEKRYFVVVEYYDYISERNYYILYRCEKAEEESDYGVALEGDDLFRLNLFYAGTTHKLQGSQAKLVIAVVQRVNYKGFITRNMVYTMVTRAEKLEFLIGSVDNGKSSQLSISRKEIADDGILTIGSVLD